MQQKFIRSVGLSIILTLLPYILFAQTTGDVVASDDTTQNSFVGNFHRKFMVKTFMATRNLTFNIKNRIGARESVTYSPNGNYFLGAGLFYKKIGLELGFKLPVSDRLNAKYGQTRYLDLQTNFYGTRFGGDLAYQRYTGFYPRNPALLDSTWSPGKAYPYRSDIRARNIAANVFYVFNNKRFSYKAAYTQTEKQLQSAGSFILMVSFAHLLFDGNQALLSASGDGVSAENTNFQWGRFYNTSLLPGYAYTFVVDDFYFSGSVHIGGGTQFKTYMINDSQEKDFNFAWKNHVRVAGGYNGRRWMAGASAIIDNTPFRMQQVTLSASNFNVKLFAGYRFNSRPVDQKIDKNLRKIKAKYNIE
ncbi:DUF4421 family protein [Rhodocytophaga aerolata]|uniref:DUF4421 family protein n=1 Tax=Rhodocytophaga aerolata TaxID=455078 RepID=A0ABT8R3U6_9BACT|nr:DUF4421 family protein [Rhodocytophaga aerolata]MDO1446776.1 DUF4421 family protein [Rhodocytophaga aerolata]